MDYLWDDFVWNNFNFLSSFFLTSTTGLRAEAKADIDPTLSESRCQVFGNPRTEPVSIFHVAEEIRNANSIMISLCVSRCHGWHIHCRFCGLVEGLVTKGVSNPENPAAERFQKPNSMSWSRNIWHFHKLLGGHGSLLLLSLCVWCLYGFWGDQQTRSQTSFNGGCIFCLPYCQNINASHRLSNNQ